MTSLSETFKSLGPARLAMMAGVLAGIALFFIFLVTRLSNTDMALLYGSLSLGDSGSVAAKLEQINIPYEISSDGTSISVPSNEVGRARMALAEEGLPGSASVGYEIFDDQSAFGTTDFVQNVNQVRALEGEIAKTISTLRSIRHARIHLVLPKRELFSRESQPATASVFVRLRPGQTLSKEQTLAIQHMVATAVPQLKPSRVSIVDESGKLLARGVDDSDDPSSLFLSPDSEGMRLRYEQRVTRMIEDIVGQIVGQDNVRASVSASLDFDRISLNEEIYDPEGQVVRSTQTIEETEEERDGNQAQGVTVQNNLPGLNQVAGANNTPPPTNAASRTEEVTNFEISKTIRNHIKESGQVTRLSVAVLVDGTYTEAPATEEGAEPQQIYQPRSADELEQIETLVRSAIGFDDGRGDTIEVINMEFTENALPLAVNEIMNDTQLFGFEKSDLLDIAETITLAIVALLVVLLVLQPLVNKLIESAAGNASQPQEDSLDKLITSQMQQQASLAPPGQNQEESNSGVGMIDMDKVEGRVKASSVQKVGDLVEKHPQETVSVLRNWMYQEN